MQRAGKAEEYSGLHEQCIKNKIRASPKCWFGKCEHIHTGEKNGRETFWCDLKSSQKSVSPVEKKEE
jgi:hypothetical protein